MGSARPRSESDEMFGYERLLHHIEAISHQSAQEIAASLFEAVAEFGTNCPQDDDQTVVVIKAVGS